LKVRIEETNASRCLHSKTKGSSNFLTIGDLIEKIKDKEVEITQIEREIDQILGEQQERIEDDELAALKQTVEQRVTQHKLLLNDKSALFEEMYSKALLMINGDL
jgi:hypothetical protein